MAQMEQQSAQEKFNASVEKLKEIFTQVMDALAPIFDVLSSIATVVMPAINLSSTTYSNCFYGYGENSNIKF
jgi:phage-related protein